MKRLRVVVCRGPECGSASGAITAALRDRIAARELAVELCHQSCFGRCRSGPNLVVSIVDPRRPRVGFGLASFAGGGPSRMYNEMTPQKALDALEASLEGLHGKGRGPHRR